MLISQPKPAKTACMCATKSDFMRKNIYLVGLSGCDTVPFALNHKCSTLMTFDSGTRFLHRRLCADYYWKININTNDKKRKTTATSSRQLNILHTN